MIILGINGGYEHDASACIVVNGELKAYAEEERFVKIKHAVGYLPIYSVWYCLNELQISMNDVDMICASWLPDKYHPDIVKNILGNPIFDCKKKSERFYLLTDFLCKIQYLISSINIYPTFDLHTL